MKVEIKETKENPMLNRKEISFLVKEVKTTPSRKEVRQKIASLTNIDEKNFVVDVFDTRYGTSEFKGTARVYKNNADLKRTELKPIVVRNFGKEEEKKKETKKAEEAKPAEETKAKAEEAPVKEKGDK